MTLQTCSLIKHGHFLYICLHAQSLDVIHTAATSTQGNDLVLPVDVTSFHICFPFADIDHHALRKFCQAA